MLHSKKEVLPDKDRPDKQGTTVHLGLECLLKELIIFLVSKNSTQQRKWRLTNMVNTVVFFQQSAFYHSILTECKYRGACYCYRSTQCVRPVVWGAVLVVPSYPGYSPCSSSDCSDSVCNNCMNYSRGLQQKQFKASSDYED